MADNKVIFEIDIREKGAVTKVKGTTTAVKNLGNEVKKVNSSAKSMNKNLKGVNDAAGLTSATITSLGQGVGDLRYGFGAIANNLTQVGSLFGNLTAKSGGFGKALKNIGSSLIGPAGVFLAFNVVVAAIDYFTSSMGKAEEKIKDTTNALEEQLKTYKDLQLILSELEGEDRVKFLTEIALKERKVAEALKEAGTNEAKRSEIIEQLIADIERKIAIETTGMELVEAKRQEIEAKKLRSELETRGKNARERNRDKKEIEKIDANLLLIQDRINTKTKEYTKLLKDTKVAATEMTEPLIEFYNQLDVDTVIDSENANPTGILSKLMGDDFGEDVSIGSIGMGFIEDFEFVEQLDSFSEFIDAKQDLRNKDLTNEQEAFNLRQRITMMTAGLTSILGQSMKEGSKEAARVQQLGALINAFASINEIWSKKGSSPFLSASIAEKIAATASVGAITFGNVKSIEQASNKLGGSGGGSNAPQRSFDFNIVGGNTGNEDIVSAINSQGQVVKAYVTTTDVKTASQLEDNLVNKATITDD